MIHNFSPSKNKFIRFTAFLSLCHYNSITRLSLSIYCSSIPCLPLLTEYMMDGSQQQWYQWLHEPLPTNITSMITLQPHLYISPPSTLLRDNNCNTNDTPRHSLFILVSSSPVTLNNLAFTHFSNRQMVDTEPKFHHLLLASLCYSNLTIMHILISSPSSPMQVHKCLDTAPNTLSLLSCLSSLIVKKRSPALPSSEFPYKYKISHYQ